MKQIPENRTVNINNSIAFLLTKKQTANSNKIEKSTITVDNMPVFCYSIFNNSSTYSQRRQLVNTLYLDSLFNQPKDIAIDFSGKKTYKQVINNAAQSFVSIKFMSDTYLANSISIYNYVTNILSVNRNRKVLGIGDSITAMKLYNPMGESAEYWNYISKIKVNNLKDKIDNPSLADFQMIGNLNGDSRTISYRGQNLSYKAFSAAQSGWACSHYMYHPIQLSGIDVGPTMDRSISGRPTPEISYYLLGLVANGGGIYSGSTAQIELIRHTKSGKFNPDKNAILYNWMKIQSGWIGANDTYTGTVTQNNNIDIFWESILDNPLNPFFSKSKARDSSPNCFSMTTYLSRYKTLEDDGITRLNNITKGTKVTDVNAHDLCTPTDIVLNWLENDIWLFPNTPISTLVDMVIEMANTISIEIPNAKIAIITNPRPGTNFPNLVEEGVRFLKSEQSDRKDAIKSEIRNMYVSKLGITPSIKNQGNIYYVDTYMFCYPLSHSLDQSGESAGQSIPYEENTKSGVHIGLYSHASIADQLYSWLCYTN